MHQRTGGVAPALGRGCGAMGRAEGSGVLQNQPILFSHWRQTLKAVDGRVNQRKDYSEPRCNIWVEDDKDTPSSPLHWRGTSLDHHLHFRAAATFPDASGPHAFAAPKVHDRICCNNAEAEKHHTAHHRDDLRSCLQAHLASQNVRVWMLFTCGLLSFALSRFPFVDLTHP